MAHILPPQPDGLTLQETTEKIVNELKSRGNFDAFRKACLADVDTRPAYQNLRQRVESTVTLFLGKQKWTPDLNRNQLREKLRKHLTESSFLEIGVDRIVDQVVDRNIYSTYMPQIQLLVKEMLDIKDEAEENADDDVEMEEATPAAPETGGNTFGTWANQFHARVPEPRPDEPAAASNSSMSISSATNESAAGSAAGSPSEGESPDIRAQMSPLSDDGKQGWGSFLGKSDGLDFSGIMNRVGHIDPAIDQMIKSELESETRETEASAAPTQRSGSSNSNMSLQQEEETVDLQSFVGPPEGHEPHDSHRKDADRDPPLPPRPPRDEPDRGGRGDTEPRGRHPSDEERRRRERERDRDRGGRRDRPRHDDDRGSRHGDEDRYRRERDRDRDRERGDRDRDRDRRDRDRGDDHEEQRSRARHHQRRDRDDDDASGHRGRSGGYSHGGRGHGRSDDRGGGGGGAGGSGQRYHGYNSGRERPAGKDEPMDGVAAEVEVAESVKDDSMSATVKTDSAEATSKADGTEKRSVSKDRKDTSKERDRKATSKDRDRKRSESRSRRESSSTHKKSSRRSDESSERKSSAKKPSSSEKRSDKYKHKTPSASSSGSTSPSKSSDRAAESASKQKVNSGDSSPAETKSSSPASPSSSKSESSQYKSPQIKSDSKLSPVVSLERISDAMLRANHLSVPSSVAAEKSNTKPPSVTAKPSTVPSAATAEKSKSAPSSATTDKPNRPSSAMAKPNIGPSSASVDKSKAGPSSAATDKPSTSSATPAKSSGSSNQAPSGTKDRMAQLMEKYAPYLKDRFRRSEQSSKPKPKPSSSRKSSSSSQNTYLGERTRPVSPSSRSRVRYLKQVIDDPETLSVSSVDTADLSDFDDNLDMELELTEPERDSLFKIGWRPVVDDLADADDDDVATAIEDFVQVVDLCDDAESVDSGFNRSDASSSTSAGSGRPASAVLPSDPPVIDLEPVAEAEAEAPATGRRRRQRKVDYIALNSGLDGEDKEAGASRRRKRPRGDGDWNPDGKTSRVGPSRGAEAIPTLSLRRQPQGNVRGKFEKDEWQVSSDKENMDGMTRLRDPGAAGDSVRIRPNLII